jgi:hypothetical protein
MLYCFSVDKGHCADFDAVGRTENGFQWLPLSEKPKENLRDIRAGLKRYLKNKTIEISL